MRLAQVAGAGRRAAEAAAWLGAHLRVDVDARVHVFEVTIRALGEQPEGLSASMVASGCPSHHPVLIRWGAAPLLAQSWSAAWPHAGVTIQTGAQHACEPGRGGR